ncbi:MULTISPECIES: right-handed parallel beta-helix repeat-containing protein [unclassified Pseudoxanthomonas]|uniref:prealbumin-like fold domain-containing protein n=1 Tax=unclassified Pseudoxanthomonas TaxID=2645906 RepID=UPI00307F38B1
MMPIKISKVLLIALALFSFRAYADTYTVTTLGDSVGLCTGASPSFSCTTLRAAIDEANATMAVDDTIVFSVSGTITLSSTLPIVTDTVIINGANAVSVAGGAFESLIFEGQEADDSQLLNLGFTGTVNPATTMRVNGASNMLIQGNTFTMGVTTGSAILVSDSDNVTTNDNQVTGGVYSINYYNTDGSPYLGNPAYNGTITNNTVTGGSSGIALFTADNILVDGNTITNSTGIGIRLGMQFDGPYGASNNIITNNTVTGGSNSGVSVTGYGGGGQIGVFNNNLIQGNTITNNSGAGVRLPSTNLIQTNGNVITGNIITGNQGDGVNITGINAADNIVYANTNISGNLGLGIDLATNGVTPNDPGDADTGPNGVQNFPVVTSTAGNTVKFVLDTTANPNGYRIDFHNNPGGVDPTGYGEGQVWLGSCVVASPSATLPSSCNVAGMDASTLRMTATRCLTATCDAGATSEFSGPSTTNLSLTKTDGQTTYTTGQALVYTLVVTNNGTASVSDAVFTDPAVAGLSVTDVTCGSATLSSECPAAANTTVALMQGAGLVVPLLTPGGSVTFTLTATATATSGSLTNTASIAVPTGVSESAPADNTATDTDVQSGSIVIIKDALPNDAQDFVFTTTGTGLSDFSLDDDADATLPNIHTFTDLATGSYTVTETTVAGWTLTNLVCVDPDSGSTVNVGTGAATLDLDAGETITCTYTNSKQATVRLQKSLPGGRFNAADQFTLSIVGPGAPASVTTSGSGSTATGMVTVGEATLGGTYTLSEVVAAGAELTNYVTTYSCVNAAPGGQTPSGSGTGFSVTPAAGDDLTCEFVNTRMSKANLSITKTNTVSSGPSDLADDTVTSGTTTSYTVVVSNAGPDAADGALVRDTTTGLTCTAVSCGGTTGGAVCPSVLDVDTLQNTGVAIPTFPANSNVTFTVTCSVP